MAGLTSNTPQPTAITVHGQSRVLEVGFADGKTFRIPFELMRIYSPSAEVQGHGPGQEVLQTGKREVELDGARAGRQLRGAADASPTATTPASSPGTTSTSSARSRPSCGRSTSERLAEAGVDRDAPMAEGGRRPRLRPFALSAGDERNPLRLRHGRRERQGDARARRVRLGGAALRPDERPDVARPAPRLEGLHGAVANVRPGDKVLDIAGGTGDLARAFAGKVGAAGDRRPHRHQRGHAAHRPRPPARRRRSLPTVLCDAETLPFADGALRPRQRRLRPAQHDPQGQGAGRDGAGAEAGRQAAGARVLQGRARRWRRPTTGIRSRCCRASASSWPATAPATATWPSRSACIPTRTTLKAMMKTAGFGHVDCTT